MAKFKIDWDALYPEGYLSAFSTRHMPKVLHRRMVVIASIWRKSNDFVFVKALEVGLQQLESEDDLAELVKALEPLETEKPKRSKVEKVAMLKVRDRFFQLLNTRETKKNDLKFQDARDIMNEAIIDLL